MTISDVGNNFAFRANPARTAYVRRLSLVTVLVACAVLSLFMNIRYATGFIQLRPFEFLVGWAFMLTLFQGKIFRHQATVQGLIALLPFFACHALLAFPMSMANGLRETMQILTVGMFALVLAEQIDTLDYRLLGRIMFTGLLVLVLYLAVWGFLTRTVSGWKMLDTKASLTFFPLVLSCTFLFAPTEKRRLYIGLWLFLGAVILFSGERKALLTYCVNTAVIMARGRMLNYVPLIVALFMLFVAFANLSSNKYIEGQIETITNPFSTGKYRSAIVDGVPVVGDTWSNAQRAFSYTLGFQLFEENPLFGIGTNGYEKYISDHYWYIPRNMQVGIHNEAARIITENGLSGILSYIAIWIFSFVRVRRILYRAHVRGFVNLRQRTTLPLVCYVPCLSYLLLEATGTHSFVVLIFVSFLPDFLKHALPRFAASRRAAIAESIPLPPSLRPATSQ